MILTAAGLVAIEKIKAGDKVVATSEDTFEIKHKTVLETYKRETNELIHIQINGEEIITTRTHPFYAPEKGWVEAGSLLVNDKLRSVNGEIVFIQDIKIKFVGKPVTVYNFQVEDFHTYHVGNAGVLVHNKCDLNAGKQGSPE